MAGLECPSCTGEEVTLRPYAAPDGWSFDVATCGYCGLEFEPASGNQVVWLGDVATIDLSPVDLLRDVQAALDAGDPAALGQLLEHERHLLEQSAPNLMDEWIDDDPMVEALEILRDNAGLTNVEARAHALLPLLEAAIERRKSGEIDYTALMGRGTGWEG